MPHLIEGQCLPIESWSHFDLFAVVNDHPANSMVTCYSTSSSSAVVEFLSRHYRYTFLTYVLVGFVTNSIYRKLLPSVVP